MKYAAAIVSICAVIGTGIPTARAVDCEGTVERVRVSAQGTLEVRGTWSPETNYSNICFMDRTTENGISAETCQAWFSILLAAKLEDGKVMLAGMDSCSSGGLDRPTSIWHRD